MTSSVPGSRRERGMTMIVVLSVVIVLTVMVSWALTISGQDRSYAGKQVKNQGRQNVNESALQYARAFFATNYLAWNTTVSSSPGYLALDYSSVADGGVAPTNHPELQVPNLPTGYTCAVYARDDVDELITTNDPTHDNNLRIFVGAVCTGPNGKVSELSAPLEYNPPGTTYTGQSSGGTQGLNNYSRLQGYR
jgi:hypothetical protein